nr:hypothetical protein [Tanacetum cinerariifolium]
SPYMSPSQWESSNLPAKISSRLLGRVRVCERLGEDWMWKGAGRVVETMMNSKGEKGRVILFWVKVDHLTG